MHKSIFNFLILHRILSKEYWQSIIFLVRIAILKRDANTLLGSIWGLLQPFLHVIVISYFMSFVLKYDHKLVIKNMVGVLPFWSFIHQSLITASSSLIKKSEILKRILLPKTYFPISEVLSNLQTLLYAFCAMYVALILVFPEFFTWKIILLPIFSLPLILSVTAFGVLCAFVTPYIRDMPHFIHLMLGLIYWSIPIIYPYSIVPESKRILFEINPVFAVLRPMQDLVVTGDIPSLIIVIKSWVVCALVFILSFIAYCKLSRRVIYYL